MSSLVHVGNRTLTTDAICEKLTNSDLLPQLLREIIIDEILADWEIEIEHKIPYDREEFATGCDRLSQMSAYQGLNQLQLYRIVDRHLKLQKFKQARWSNRLYSYFLQQKDRLDKVSFSLMQVTERGLSEELFFRVQSGETSFARLAFQYSESITARDGGLIETIDINGFYPEIAPHLIGLNPGEVSGIFLLGNLHTFVRLEYHVPATLNDDLTQVLLAELFDAWVQQQISIRLGLFVVEAEPTPSELVGEFVEELVVTRSDLATLTASITVAETAELIEPKSSFFFPKPGSSLAIYPREQQSEIVPASFFLPQAQSTEIIQHRRTISVARVVSQIISFCLLFGVFLGLEIAAFNLIYRPNTPSMSISRSNLR